MIESVLPARSALSWLFLSALFLLPVQRVHAEDAYRINAGDLIEFNVWEEAELQREVRVLPDGTLSLPLVGRVRVEGMTVEEVEQELTDKLRVHYKTEPPAVTVIVKDTSGHRVYVIGEVHQSGSFALGVNLDVLQALSLAGGLTEFADSNDIHIIRRINGKTTRIDFNYGDAIRARGDKDGNVILKSGDVVVVP